MNARVATYVTAFTVTAGSHAQPVRWLPEVGGNGHYYERIDVLINWTSARSAAATRSWHGVNGHLVTITNPAENAFIVSALGGNLVRNRWIGGFQPSGSPEPGGGWTWVTGEPWSWAGWLPGEPNNAGPLGEDSAEFMGGNWPLGVWNDFHWSHVNAGYIVEYPVPSGVVAHYKFDNGIPGQVAVGVNTILDLINQYHGTPLGGPTYREFPASSGRIGLGFDGIDDRVFIPDHSRFAFADSLTIEAYIRVEGIPPTCCGNSMIVFRGDDRPGLDPYFLGVQADGRLFFAINSLSNQESRVISGLPLAQGVLFHVAGTLNGATGEQRLFVNGRLVSSATTSLRPFPVLTGQNPGVAIGNVQSGAHQQYFRGFIDEVRLANIELGPSSLLPPTCWVNCDGSYSSPVLTLADFGCFMTKYALNDPNADCNGDGMLNIADFGCFQTRFAEGCP